MVIMLDPGHGGKDPGATPEHPVEARINLHVALMTQSYLRQAGNDCLLTRTSHEQTVSLADRVNIAKEFKPSCFVSIHSNAAANLSAAGFEVLYSGLNPGGKGLAEILATAYARSLPKRRHRMDRPGEPARQRDRLFVLMNSPVPAAMMELGFVSNDAERAWLLDPDNQLAMAQALRDGILTWVRLDSSK